MSEWTEGQAVDAVLTRLPKPHDITVMQSWFKPKPRGDESPGRSEWVGRAEHAAIMLTLGRALLTLERERDEALADAEGFRNGQAQVQAVFDALWNNSINGIRLTLDEVRDPHKACALYKHDLLEARAEMARMRPVVEAAIMRADGGPLADLRPAVDAYRAGGGK